MPTLVQFCPIFYMYWRAWHYMTTLLLLMQQFLCQPITALDYMFHSMRAQQITVHFSYLATVEQKKSRSTDNCFLRLCRAPRGLQGPQPSAGARRMGASVCQCVVCQEHSKQICRQCARTVVKRDGAVQCCVHCTVWYCTVLYCTVRYCTVLYCTVLYCTVLYCTVL